MTFTVMTGSLRGDGVLREPTAPVTGRHNGSTHLTFLSFLEMETQNVVPFSPFGSSQTAP